MSTPRCTTISTLLAVCGIGLTVFQPARATLNISDEFAPVAVSELEQMRGGFDNGSGVTLSLGIERVIFVNGVPVATISIQLPDVQNIRADAAALAAAARADAAAQADAAKTSATHLAEVARTDAAALGAAARADAASQVDAATGRAQGNPSQSQVGNPAISSGASANAIPGAQNAPRNSTSGSPLQAPPPSLTVGSSQSLANPSAGLQSPQPGSSQPVATTNAVISQNFVTVVQNGIGGSISASQLQQAPAFTSIIQNSLNNQVIRGVTVINASMSGILGLARNAAFLSALGSQLGTTRR
jgi:hypothetical protein